MSVDKDFFSWPTSFSCVLILKDVILPCSYNLTISMLPNTDDFNSVGLTKIKQFIAKFIQNSTIINTNHYLIDQVCKFKTNTIQLPQEASDYFIAAILFKKLNAISRNYFTINQITIDSDIGDRVKYQITDTSNAYDTILENEGWWNDDSVSTNAANNFPTWEDLFISTPIKFSPKLLKGGKNENNQI